eukprot:TRINITY_DN10956_c0_g1_i1.p1 TRINITY_DN10956_c0_g1~~TRINITY_DN10956_c0_g1_i1.p1  ORF type:complete len:688 (+),score=211.78 TRINITY_DN10956_c0_g1_i1:47-2065(+)
MATARLLSQADDDIAKLLASSLSSPSDSESLASSLASLIAGKHTPGISSSKTRSNSNTRSPLRKPSSTRHNRRKAASPSRSAQPQTGSVANADNSEVIFRQLEEAHRRIESLEAELSEAKASETQLKAHVATCQTSFRHLYRPWQEWTLTSEQRQRLQAPDGNEFEAQVQLRLHDISAEILRSQNSLQQQLQQIADDNEEDNQELLLLRKRHLEATTDVTRLRAELKSLQAQDTRLHSVLVLQQERDQLRDANLSLKAEVERLGNAVSANTTDQTEIAQLQQEKEAARREAQLSQDRASLLKEQVEQLQTALAETKALSQAQQEKLQLQRHSDQAKVESTFQAELAELRQRNAVELEQIRSQSKEVTTAALEAAHRERDLAIELRMTAEANLKLERDTSAGLNMELRSLQVSSETNIAQAQAKLKLLEYQAERSEALLDETRQQLATVSSELEQHRRQKEVLMQEYYQLKANHEHSQQRHQDKIGHLEKQLEGYEQLEAKIDIAVSSGSATDDLLSSKGALLSSAQRRIAQAVELARDNLSLKQELSQAKEDLADLEQKLADSEKKYQHLTEQMALAEQPYAYVISKLAEKDDDIENLEAQLRAKHALAQSYQDRVLTLEDEKAQLLAAVDELSEHQHALQELQQQLNQLKPPSASSQAKSKTDMAAIIVHN